MKLSIKEKDEKPKKEAPVVESADSLQGKIKKEVVKAKPWETKARKTEVVEEKVEKCSKA